MKDAIAGVTVTAFLVPQCMAYAQLAGLRPVTGLWAALPALVVYALFGSSSRLSLGPESTSALLVGAAVATLAARYDTPPEDIAAALAVAVGAVGLCAWLIRLGFLADLLSRPVLVGYMTGVAVVMVVGQLPGLMGIPSAHHDTVGRARDVLGALGNAQLAPLLMGLGVLAALLVLRHNQRLPSALLVILGAALADKVFNLGQWGIAKVGPIPQGFPSLGLPSIPSGLWLSVLGSAAGIFVVAYADDILTARAFARRSSERIDASQELLALAGANASAGLFGGFPVSSSASRTAVAEASGGRTQLVSIVAAGALMVVLLVAGPLLESFPLPALAGLIVYAAIGLVDVKEIDRVMGFRRAEALVMMTAFAGVVVLGALIGIAIAVGLSVAGLFAHIARAHDAVQGAVPGVAGLHDVDDYPQARTIPGLVVYRYDAPLCFANAEDFHARVLKSVAAEASRVEWVLLNMEANVEIDLTALDMLEDLRLELESRNIVLALARVKRDLAIYVDRTGLSERIGSDHIFFTLPTAVEAFERRTVA
jgi:high affinity sulfate transporter 1